MVFVVALFLWKNGLLFFNNQTSYQNSNQNGLVYGTATIEDLVNKSSAGDGVPDWEKLLFGMDPTKKGNIPISSSEDMANNDSNQATQTPDDSKLTQTDKFSRELFSSVAAVSQNGTVDQNTINQIGDSLANHVKNTVQRKIYTITDIKIINNDLNSTIQKYADTLNGIYKKPQLDYTAIDVLRQFINDNNSVDVTALAKLDPIITQSQDIINKVAKMSVPESIATLHLDLLNGMEKMLENLNDIKLYDTDPIVALGGINQYETNANALQSTIKNLSDLLTQKLNN